MKAKIQAVLVVLLFVFFSCQKKEIIEPTTNLSDLQLKSATIAVNDVAVESVVQEANFETNMYAGYENLLRRLAQIKGKKGNLLDGKTGMHYEEGNAPVVSIDTAETGYPIIITIEYGDGTSTENGRVISGTVKIELSGKKGTDGSTRNISYIGCSIDSIGIEGTSTETFNGDNTITSKMTIESNVSFTLADGTVIERVGTDVREWLKGLNTPTERTDDVIQTTGSIKVESSTGDNYLRSITDPLIQLGDCHHPVQGIVQYSKNGSVISELNYGDGTCDNLAQLTTDGTTVDIELKGKMPKANLDGVRDAKKDGTGGTSGNGEKGKKDGKGGNGEKEKMGVKGK